MGISKDMTVREIITLVPAAADIMIEYGLNCFSCSVGGVEMLEQGCQLHQLDEDTIEALIEDINDAIGKAPKRPQEIIITSDAAKALSRIASEQGKGDQILVVTVDEQGGFCLEFQDSPLTGDMEFSSPEVPEMKVYASVLTLSRIGGATIDFREERFKLDLEDECCGDGGSCGCGEMGDKGDR